MSRKIYGIPVATPFNPNKFTGGGGGGSGTETDPTVPAWAKQPQKPTYTASEVGALPADTEIPKAVTDEHINSLIDAKLGVIENGTY